MNPNRPGVAVAGGGELRLPPPSTAIRRHLIIPKGTRPPGFGSPVARRADRRQRILIMTPSHRNGPTETEEFPHMKPRLLTPGPTPVPEETLLELAKPVTFHRSPDFRAVLAEVVEDLKYVFQTKNTVLVLTASGTGGMEAAVSSVVAPGEKAILLISGRWGERWRGICKAFGVNIVPVEVPYGEAVRPEQLEKALTQHPDAVAVFATFSETSTGVRNDIEAFGKIVAKTPAVLCVDTISGLGVMECRTDAWHVDVNVTGSQKALMLPPGL